MAEARGQSPAESYARAETDYRSAIDKGHPAAYANLGLLLQATGRYADAISAFEAAGRGVPGFAARARELIEETRKLMDKSRPGEGKKR